MIKVALKGIFGTVVEVKFKTFEEALAWIDLQPYDGKWVIGYTIEEVDECEKMN